MRTISAKHPKGQVPPRTLEDSVRLLLRIFSTGVEYFVKGGRIRRDFYQKQKVKEKIYIDEIDWI